MFILTALLALLGRSSARLLNIVFGWAIVLFFGKLPEERQVYLSIMAFGSVIWLFVLLGLPFPIVGVFLLTFVPLPSWVETSWIRLAMLAATLLVPLAVGVISLRLRPPGPSLRGLARAVAVLQGFPYTFGMAAALVLMTLFAPVLRLRTVRRLWTTQHVPIGVSGQAYEGVIRQIAAALRERGWKAEYGPASWMLRLPTWIITACAGSAVEGLIQNRLMKVSSARFEVVLHPADLVINGRAAEVTRVRIALAERLAFSPAYQTWTAPGNRLEERLTTLWRALQEPGGREPPARTSAALQAASRDLDTADLPYEEWEVLYRKRLLVECALLRKAGAGPACGKPERGDASANRGEAAQPAQREGA